jgi:hypothetical protein
MGFRLRTWLVGACLSAAVSPLAAQATPDSTTADTTVVAGHGYGLRGPLGWLQKWIFGSRHRKLWDTPVEVERLDLTSVGGGLTPLAADSGRRAGYLYLRAADGSLYTFRQMAPDLRALLPSNLQNQLGAGLLQDFQSGRHPGAPFIVPVLAQAIGEGPLPEPRLVLLPEDSTLNRFGPRFSGTLGFLRPGIQSRFWKVAGVTDAAVATSELLERLEAGVPTAIDSLAYLNGRLFDLYLGSWDPLPEEWLWLQGTDGVWRPLPRNRDLAFLRLDGLVAGLAGWQVPNFATFSGDYDTRLAVTSHQRTLDRHLLMAVEKSSYLALARKIQQGLTDSVIEAAVRQEPATYYGVSGEKLIRDLKHRRDQLPQATERFYRMVIERGEVYGSEAADTITAERRTDGGLQVSVGSRFARRFEKKETDEVRLYLLPGDDEVRVTGKGHDGPNLTIAAGAGDVVVDSSGAGRLTVRDTAGVRVSSTGKVHLDPEPLLPPTFVDSTPREPPPVQGSRYSFSPWLDLNSDLGLFIGGGPVRTTYDFGYDPYKSRIRIRAAYATAPNAFDVDFKGEWHRRNSGVYYLVDAEASAVEVLKFFGYGNETVRDSSDTFYNAGQRLYVVSPAIVFPIAPKSKVKLGPTLKYVSTDLGANTFIAQDHPYGTDGFGQVGIQASVLYDTRDSWRFATRGVLLSAGSSYYPEVWSAEQAFGEVDGSAATYVTPTPAFTVGIRGSGKYVWGKYPVHEAAAIGGSRTVRGYSKQRFAGDAALYSNIDAKLRLGTIPFVMVWDMGIQGVADVGRVFLAGETSDVWHYGIGGGMWAALPDRSFMGLFTITFSDERATFWGGVGFIF